MRLEKDARPTMPGSVSSVISSAKLGISRQKSKLSPTFLLNRRPKTEITIADGKKDRPPAHQQTRVSHCLLPRGNAKLVNAAPLSAQSVHGTFAIVKAARRESLGIIKTKKICSEKNAMKIKGFFTFKHIGKIIKEQIFTVI